MIIKFEIKSINIEDCVYDIDVYNVIQSEIGSAPVLKYFLFPHSLIVYVLTNSEEGMNMVGDGVEFKTTEFVVRELLKEFPDSFKKTTPVGKNVVVDRYTDEEMAEMQKRWWYAEQQEQRLLDEYLVNQKRVNLADIDIVNGTVMIFSSDGSIVLLQDKYYKLDYDRDSYDTTTGTVILVRTNEKNSVLKSAEYFDKLDRSTFENALNSQITDAVVASEARRTDVNIDLIEDLMNTIDAIVNDEPYTIPKERADALSNYERGVKFMKDLLIDVRNIDGDKTTLVEAEKNSYEYHTNIPMQFVTTETAVSEDNVEENKETEKLWFEQFSDVFREKDELVNGKLKEDLVMMNAEGDKLTYEIATNGDLSINGSVSITANNIHVLTEDEINVLSKVTSDTSTETISVQNAVISIESFYSYAANHHIIAWDLNTPSTLSIKFIEGTTPKSAIDKFHTEVSKIAGVDYKLKNVEDTQFLVDLINVMSDDNDVVQEFINRVNKHNIFVKESTAKIRSALLDMERDFKSLKSDVNLAIDWDKLTAFATKKERSEHRLYGVTNTIDVKNANVVKVESMYSNDEFYIPLHLLTDELREKYTYGDDLLHIEDVPDFVFYEVKLNGHYMLIEKTNLK